MSDLEQKNQSETEVETENGTSAEAQAPAAKPTLFQRYKAHMKKWWWVYVIVVCCIVLVVVLPIVYVGVPRFASKYINDYEYDYTGLKITNPTPDSFHVYQAQDLKVSGPFSSASGHLNAFNAAVYSLLDSDADSVANNDPLSNFPVPNITFGGGKGFTIDQDLNISCVDCLSRVAATAASDQEIKMLIKGDPNLKVGALPNAHLNIHKIMTMQGYNVKEFLNMKGSFNVTGIDLMKERNDQGYNVNATVSFKNPSPFIVEMGTVTFNLSISGTSAGNVTVPNLFLSEGITETYILGDIDKDQLIHGGLGGSDPGSSLGDVTIDLQGDRVVYQGVEIPYFTAAIRAVQAPVKVNLLDYVSDIL